MSRLIDADLIQYEPMLSAKGNGMYEDVMVAYKSQIDDIPTIERKTGKWIRGKCDQCGAHAPFWPMASTYYESDYCPNCGARMEI